MKLPLILEKATAKEKWMLFLLVGLLLAVIIFPTGKTQSISAKEDSDYAISKTYSNEMTISQYEMYLSQKLEEILTQIDGAGNVQAWVTIASGKEQVFVRESDKEEHKLEESDSTGGTRKEEDRKIKESVLKDSSGNPYIVKTIQPEVEGVLVVAEGAGDSVIKKNISEAVQVLYGIEANRIKVAKKKVEE